MIDGQTQNRWRAFDLAQVPGVACPCGTSHRSPLGVDDSGASLHLVEISLNARLHYHKRLTETYYVLECEPGAKFELDGQQIDAKPGMCVLIPPGVRHRAVGRMKILNFVVPSFDPDDEWFD